MANQEERRRDTVLNDILNHVGQLYLFLISLTLLVFAAITLCFLGGP